MSRSEIFTRAYPDEGDNTPLFEAEYRRLKALWDEMPGEARDVVLELPSALQASGELDPAVREIYSLDGQGQPISSERDKALLQEVETCARRRAEHVRLVDQRYRHRMATEFVADLPDIFRRVMMMADDEYALDLLFFGTLGALSACMPGVKGSYDIEVIQPNIFLFVTGNAASGKGRIGFCRKLLEPLHKSHPFWQFIIPANSSDTAIYAQLAENQGRGIIFETEADTLSNALGKASGKFGEGLRKAFHNETISYQRRTNDERVVINNPVLSAVLTSTPKQLSRLIPDPEDGLYSRFLFYRLQSGQESFPKKNPIHRGITGEMVNDYMEYLGEMVSAFFDRLLEKCHYSGCSVRFTLTEEQEQQFQQYFNRATKEHVQLVREAYKSEERAAEAESIMRRLGNICYRMMMVMSVSRLITEEKPEIPDDLVCDQRDFDLVMAMEHDLRHHNLIHYDEMLVAGGAVPPLEMEDADEGDMLSPAQRMLFQRLPGEFIKQEAEQLGLKMSLSKATLKRYIDRYIDLGLLKRIKKGVYEKTGRGEVGSEDSQ